MFGLFRKKQITETEIQDINQLIENLYELRKREVNIHKGLAIPREVNKIVQKIIKLSKGMETGFCTDIKGYYKFGSPNAFNKIIFNEKGITLTLIQDVIPWEEIKSVKLNIDKYSKNSSRGSQVELICKNGMLEYNLYLGFNLGEKRSKNDDLLAQSLYTLIAQKRVQYSK